MPVIATCSDCGDRHELGDRQIRVGGEPETSSGTTCPVCDAPAYGSDVTNRSPKSQATRIRDAVEPVHGVGAETAENLVASFHSYEGLRDASLSRLTRVDGVGRTTAERIQDRV